ncbi:MAG: TetR/AcrR family transcriptional regulator [Candidatus Lokiarchaeota archaeon]|nr:TetR/AcrR family transcriptional regulator [Candidatus Lokiarchaeota archaeon]
MTKTIEDKIINTTLKLISETGYGNLSARKIARKVGISVSTLLYHFPQGKFSILTRFSEKLTEELKLEEILSDGVITDEELRFFFLRDLDLARKMRPMIIALEIETLSKPDLYLAYGEKHATNVNIDSFKIIIEKVAGKPVNESQFKKALSVWKALIRRHVIFRNLFGSDDEFIDMILKVIKALTMD